MQEEVMMKKITCIVLVMILGLATLVVAAEEKPRILVTTGGIGGVYYYYGTTVAEILTKYAGVEATAIQTAASVDNLLLIQRRTSPAKNTYYLGTVLPDSAYLAYSGKLDRFKDKPAKEIRIMWAMYPNYLHLVAVSGSSIKTVADLKGKRVSTGAPGSGTEVEAFMVLDAAGLKTSDLGKQERLGASESSEAMSQGTLDAYFWSGGLPTASVTELATSLARKGSKIEFVDMPPRRPGKKTSPEIPWSDGSGRDPQGSLQDRQGQPDVGLLEPLRGAKGVAREIFLFHHQGSLRTSGATAGFGQSGQGHHAGECGKVH